MPTKISHYTVLGYKLDHVIVEHIRIRLYTFASHISYDQRTDTVESSRCDVT